MFRLGSEGRESLPLAFKTELARGVVTWGCVLCAGSGLLHVRWCSPAGMRLWVRGWPCWHGTCYGMGMGLQGSVDCCSVPAECEERSFGFEQEPQQLLDMKTPSVLGQGWEGFNRISGACQSLRPDVLWARGYVSCWGHAIESS